MTSIGPVLVPLLIVRGRNCHRSCFGTRYRYAIYGTCLQGSAVSSARLLISLLYLQRGQKTTRAPTKESAGFRPMAEVKQSMGHASVMQAWWMDSVKSANLLTSHGEEISG